jgi:protein ImuB
VDLVERLGQPGLHLQRLASGKISRTLVPVDPPLRFEESFEFEDSIEDLDSLLLVLNRLLKQITERLILRSQATDELRLTLGLEVHEDRNPETEFRKNSPRIFERTLRLPITMQDRKVLLKLLQLDLAQRSPGAAVKSVTLEARAAQRRLTQGNLFAPSGPEPERLEVTLARIRGVVGEADPQGRGRVGWPEVLDSHQPDDFRVAAFTVCDLKDAAVIASRDPSITMTMFRPPLLAHVLCQAGKPTRISFAEITCSIIRAAGPWSASGNWWKKKDGEWRREEWDIAVELSNGVGLYRIFRDLLQNTWFVEGLYE